MELNQQWRQRCIDPLLRHATVDDPAQLEDLARDVVDLLPETLTFSGAGLDEDLVLDREVHDGDFRRDGVDWGSYGWKGVIHPGPASQLVGFPVICVKVSGLQQPFVLCEDFSYPHPEVASEVKALRSNLNTQVMTGTTAPIAALVDVVKRGQSLHWVMTRSNTEARVQRYRASFEEKQREALALLYSEDPSTREVLLDLARTGRMPAREFFDMATALVD